MKVVAVVLAAGAEHPVRVAEAARAARRPAPPAARPRCASPTAGLADVVVVLGRGADDVEAAIAWRAERRVVNPRPEDGLSSSLRVGPARPRWPTPRRTRSSSCSATSRASGPTSCEAVVAAAETAPVPIVRPRYAADDAPNPVLRPAGRLAARRRASTGDRGLGPAPRRAAGPRAARCRSTARTRTSTPSRTSRDSRAYRDPRCRLGAPPPPIASSPPGPSASGRTASRPSGSARRRRRTSTPRSRRCSSPTPGGPTSRRSPRSLASATEDEVWLDIGAGRRPLRAPARPRRARGHRRRAVGRHARRAADGDGGARDRQRARGRGRVAGVARARWATCRRRTSR